MEQYRWFSQTESYCTFCPFWKDFLGHVKGCTKYDYWGQERHSLVANTLTCFCASVDPSLNLLCNTVPLSHSHMTSCLLYYSMFYVSKFKTLKNIKLLGMAKYWRKYSLNIGYCTNNGFFFSFFLFLKLTQFERQI